MKRTRISPWAVLLIGALVAVFLLYPCLGALHTCSDSDDVCPVCAVLCEVRRTVFTLAVLACVFCPVPVLFTRNFRPVPAGRVLSTPTKRMDKLSD